MIREIMQEVARKIDEKFNADNNKHMSKLFDLDSPRIRLMDHRDVYHLRGCCGGYRIKEVSYKEMFDVWHGKDLEDA